MLSDNLKIPTLITPRFHHVSPVYVVQMRLIIWHVYGVDNLRFYILLSIPGRLEDTQRLRSMKPILLLNEFPPPAGIESGIARSIGQGFTGLNSQERKGIDRIHVVDTKTIKRS